MLAALLLLAGPAQAALSDLTVPRQSLALGPAELRLDADASLALFGRDQPGGPGQTGGLRAAGAFSLMPDLRRDYDSGLSLGISGTFTHADTLSRDVYDGDLTERLVASARTGLGTLDLGISDGAASVLYVGGPQVEHDVSINDPRTSFFRNPQTGRAVTNIFSLRTPVGASTNYAKLLYTSPELFGVQLALSYTPSQSKDLLLSGSPNLPGRQADFWEAALRYCTEMDAGFGAMTVTGYGAVAQGRGEQKLPGQEGVSDLGAGLRVDYPVTDDIAVSVGGSWRQTNAYAFDINQPWQPSVSRGQHVSAMVAHGGWLAGIEFGNGVARDVAIAGLPRLGLNALQLTAGYQLSSSLQLTTGWQHLSYARSSGTFFNGANQLKMDAVYLHINLKTVE